MYMRAKQGISYLPQEASVFRRLSVRQNIMAVLELVSSDPNQREKRLNEILEDLDIKHIQSVKGYALSGGERRRVEIARALATNPDFMLLDEPFAGIDPIVVHDIQNIVAGLKARGIGVIITDHNVREAFQISDRVYIINEGQILESGIPEEIAASDKARGCLSGRKISSLKARGINMALQHKMVMKTEQRLVMTAMLRQAIGLLPLNRTEMQQAVQQEMLNNPLLEEIQDEMKEVADGDMPELRDDVPESQNDERGEVEIDWGNIVQDNYDDFSPTTFDDEFPSHEQTLARPDTLHEHLAWQLSLSVVPEPIARVAEQIIWNVNDEGYIEVDAEGLADSVGLGPLEADKGIGFSARIQPTWRCCENTSRVSHYTIEKL